MLDLSVTPDEFSRMVCVATMMEPTNTLKPALWAADDFFAVGKEIEKLEAMVRK